MVRSKIIQIMPCNVEMYAIYKGNEKAEEVKRVIAFGLNQDGEIKPLVFDCYCGIWEADTYNTLSRYEMVNTTSETPEQREEKALKQMLRDLEEQFK